jgi:hypothetical protein
MVMGCRQNGQAIDEFVGGYGIETSFLILDF